MSLDRTLQQVEVDIRAGDLGKARDRLHGLIVSYPDNLALRQQLAQVYWQLNFPEMAGRYWYLVEDKSEEMLQACRRFEAQFRNDPALMLFAIKFKGDMEAIRDTYAGRLLANLHRQAREKYSWYEAFRKRGPEKYHHYKYEAGKHRIRDFFLKWGCIAIAALVAVLFSIGVIDGLLRAIHWAK